MSNVHVSGNHNFVISAGGDVVLDPSAQVAGRDAFAPAPRRSNGPISGPTCDAGTGGKILFLSANASRERLDLELELRRIEDHLLRGHMRDRLALKSVPAVTVDALMRTMMEEAPTHVHFSGHGRSEGIVLRDELGKARVVSGEALGSLFKLFRKSVRCVVLNACYSEPQARAIREHVPSVVGSRDRIEDAAALSFSSGFYMAVAAGKDVPYAFEMGKARMRLDNVPGEENLVLL
jgi:CHAT domain